MLSRFIRGAGSSLDAAVYEVSGYYAYLFDQAARAGVATRLLLDGHGGANATTRRRLAGGPVRCRVAGGMAHWKLLISGHDRLAVGSGNLIKRDAPRDPEGRLPPHPVAAGPGTREWWAFASGVPGLVAAARSAFESAWLVAVAPGMGGSRVPPGTPPAVGVPRPLVAPLTLPIEEGALRLAVGGASVKALIEELIAGCRRRVELTTPYIRPDAAPVRDLVAAMGRAGLGGAATRLLLGGVPDREQGAGLAGLPALVRVMDPLRSTTGHAKGVIGDDSVIVASANWSGPGMGSNGEAALRIDHPDAARYFAAAFQRDWTVSRALDSFGFAADGRGYAGTALPRPLTLEP